MEKKKKKLGYSGSFFYVLAIRTIADFKFGKVMFGEGQQ